MAPTRRRRMPAAQRREVILVAAEETFARSGYHGASLDDIAQAAGVSKALIYEHFESKRELHGSLLDAQAAEIFRRLEAAAARGETGEERLRNGIDAFLRFVEERRDAWRMLFRDPTDPESAAVLDRMVGQVTAEVTVLISQDPGARGLTRVDADRSLRLLAEMLVGAAQSMANLWTDHPETPRAELVAIAMDFAWLGLERLSRGERWSAPE